MSAVSQRGQVLAAPRSLKHHTFDFICSLNPAPSHTDQDLLLLQTDQIISFCNAFSTSEATCVGIDCSQIRRMEHPFHLIRKYLQSSFAYVVICHSHKATGVQCEVCDTCETVHNRTQVCSEVSPPDPKCELVARRIVEAIARPVSITPQLPSFREKCLLASIPPAALYRRIYSRLTGRPEENTSRLADSSWHPPLRYPVPLAWAQTQNTLQRLHRDHCSGETVLAAFDYLLQFYMTHGRREPQFEDHMTTFLSARIALAACEAADNRPRMLQPTNSFSNLGDSRPCSRQSIPIATQTSLEPVLASQASQSSQTNSSILATAMPGLLARPSKLVHSLTMIHLDERPPGSSWTPIATRDYDIVINTLSNHLCSVRTSTGQRLVYKDFVSASHYNWVKDTIIQEYLQLLKTRFPVAAFDTMFASSLLMDKPYETLRNLTNRTCLQSTETLFVPVNIQNEHWFPLWLICIKRPLC